MNILHLIDEPWDSGITAYALQAAGLQKSGGHSVVIGVLPGKKPEAQAKTRSLETAAIGTADLLRRLLAQRPWDVVNVHTGSTHSWTVALMHPLTRSLGFGAARVVPIVRTRGDAREVKAGPSARFIYRRTAAVIAASEHIGRQYAEKLGAAARAVTIIYPSITADESIAPAPAERVGILGRLDPVKGHVIFLEAAALVRAKRPAALFFIAGAEANVTVDLLRNQATALGLGEAVSFLGFHPSAREFMRSCSVGVVASIGSEEISRACQEWMAVGRPVIGTLVGCLPELIEPEETGLLVPPGDSAALADAILTALANADRSLVWGRNAWERVRRHFSPQQELDETLRVYRDAAQSVRE